jgi:phosphotransferase system  glucose/maltose/N-acetylglucosamine-specific IIC component
VVVWLTSLPVAALVVGGLGLGLLVAICGRLALSALVPAAERDSAYAIAAPLISALGAAFAILMALSLANEASSFATAQGIVSNEAADASRLAWAATSPGINSAPIQAALLDYLQATRAYEWQGSRRQRCRHCARYRQP